MTLSPRDEAQLAWFFSQGQCAFERSTVGPMLEHADLFGHAGQLRYSERSLRYELEAERIPRARSAWADVVDGVVVYPEHDLTARPTAETRSASGYVPDSRAMELHALVSKRLRTVERKSPTAVAVLECYYGDLGEQWARGGKPGRIGSVYHITVAGQRLLEASAAEAAKRGQPASLSLARRMLNEVAASKKPEHVRVRLLQAEKQAAELRIEAERLWREGGR